MFDILLLLFYLVLILAGAYFATRFLANRMGGRGVSPWPLSVGKKDSKLHIIDRMMVDKGQSLIVVVYEKEQYLIGATANGFTVLDKKPFVPPAQDTTGAPQEGFAHFLQKAGILGPRKEKNQEGEES